MVFDQFHGLGLLGLVRVLGTDEDLEAGHHALAEVVAGEHAGDGLLDHALGLALADLGGGGRAAAGAPAGVLLVDLLRLLGAGELDLLGVDDDDEGTGVDGRVEVGLVLAAEGVGDRDGEAAEGLSSGVDEQPLAVGAGIFGEE